MCISSRTLAYSSQTFAYSLQTLAYSCVSRCELSRICCELPRTLCELLRIYVYLVANSRVFVANFRVFMHISSQTFAYLLRTSANFSRTLANSRVYMHYPRNGPVYSVLLSVALQGLLRSGISVMCAPNVCDLCPASFQSIIVHFNTFRAWGQALEEMEVRFFSTRWIGLCVLRRAVQGRSTSK